MSCFVFDENKIVSLADYIGGLRTAGFDFFGYSIPEQLNDALQGHNTSDIYYQLANLNICAFNSRYDEKIEVVPYSEIEQIKILYRVNEWKDGHFVIKQWHYDLLKLLQSFMYQCEEDINRNNKLLNGLKELEKTLIFFIVQNQPEYIKAVWG